LAEGARIDAKDAWPGATPLYYAVEGGHKEIVELLINGGADINARKGSSTPLDIAIDKEHKEITQLLVDKGAMVSSIHVAAQMGYQRQTKAFLDQGIDVDLKNQAGSTPLLYAVRGRHKDIVELLVAKGADINAKDKGGYTLLYYAIWSEDVNTVKAIVTKGADVNLTAGKDYPPIYYAIWSGDIDIVKLLVAKGAKFDVKVLNDRTAFHYAVSQGSKDIVEFLVSEGIDIPRLYLSARMGDLAGIKDLVEQGADVNAKENKGQIPLQLAKDKGHTEIVELLRKHGAKE